MKAINAIGILAITAALLTFTSCETTPSAGGRVDTEAKATAELGRQKDLAEQWAGKMRRNSETIDRAKLKTAEKKFRAAASVNKGYLEAVGQGVIEKRDLSKSPAYSELAAKAEAATQDFVEFAEANSGEAAPARSAGAAVIAGILVDAGITIWNAYVAQERATREANANRLISRFTWTDWDKIQ